MRGDASLFADGMAAIAARTGWAASGLVPFLDAVRRLPAEDAADLAAWTDARQPGAKLRIAVPMLPCIANFDDLDPLRAEPEVDSGHGAARARRCRARAEVVILPGSKATIADLAGLRAEGWDIDIAAHVRAGGRVLGLCGGYQMLGRTIADPDGIEGPPGKVAGLGLLDVATVLIGDKRLARGSGHFLRRARSPATRCISAAPRVRAPAADADLRRRSAGWGGVGRRQGRRHLRAWAVHGATPRARHGCATMGAPAAPRSQDAEVEAALDTLAAHLEAHVDIDRLLSLAR